MSKAKAPLAKGKIIQTKNEIHVKDDWKRVACAFVTKDGNWAFFIGENEELTDMFGSKEEVIAEIYKRWPEIKDAA